MDKIQNYYAPKLKAYYATLWSRSHLWTKKDGLFEDINISSQKPIAIILGGQPACGKSTLINVAKKDHPNLDFLTVNGDLYRQFHPNKELIKDPIKYPIETQIFLAFLQKD